MADNITIKDYLAQDVEVRTTETGDIHIPHHIVTQILTELPAGNQNIGNVDIVTLPALVGSSANIGDVDVLTLPATAATTTKQDVIIGHVDGIEGILGTIDADTGALFGCVDGTELKVGVKDVTLPTVLVQFLITVAATQAVMVTHALKSGITLKADAGNTGSVFIGLTGVAVATGHPLAAGDTLFLELASTSTLYTIGTASDKLWVIGS